MPVTAVRQDPQSRTITLEAEFNASAERVWLLWADPRQLERWWGPHDDRKRVPDTRGDGAAGRHVGP